VGKVLELKKKYQHTGWLQYIAPFMIGSVLLILSLLSWFIGFISIRNALALFGGIFYLRFLYEILIIKYKLVGERPRQELPKDKDVFQLMRDRYSCRSFQDRYLIESDQRKLYDIIKAENGPIGHWYTGGPIEYVHVREALKVWPVVGAKEFIVALIPEVYDRQAVIEAGRRLQRIVMKAYASGISTCWIGPGADHESIRRALAKRESEISGHILCVCAVGYPSARIPLLIRVGGRRMRSRKPLHDLFFSQDDFDDGHVLPTEVAPFSKFKKVYESCQWSPSSYNAQTTRAVVLQAHNGHCKTDFYSVSQSNYYAPLAAGIWCANWEIGAEALGIQGDFSVETREEGKGLLSEEGLYKRYEISWLED